MHLPKLTLTAASYIIAALVLMLGVTLYQYLHVRLALKNNSVPLAVACADPAATDEDIYFVSCGGLF